MTSGVVFLHWGSRTRIWVLICRRYLPAVDSSATSCIDVPSTPVALNVIGHFALFY